MNLSNPNKRQAFAAQIKNEINKWCAHNIGEQRHSNRLPASMIGESCSRKLWYIFRWVKIEQFDGRMKRLFQVGNDAEPRFIKYIEGIGFKVWAHDPQTNKQFETRSCNGHFGGKSDGIATKYDITFQLEFKTNGTGAGFVDVETKGLLKAKPKHWAQINHYAYEYKIKYGLYLIENKNDSDIIVQIVELDWQYGQQLENKARDIIESKYPPQRISEQPSYYECKWCFARNICHYNEPVDNNCRSCKNAVPVEDAQWQCIKFNCLIPKEEIGKQHECHQSINL